MELNTGNLKDERIKAIAITKYLSQGEEFNNFLITNTSTKGLEYAIARFLAQHPSLEF